MSVAGAIAAGAPVVAAGVGAAGAQALSQGAGSLFASFSKPARAARKQLKKDMKRLESGNLGLSAAEKQAMLRETARSLASQQEGARADQARREAAAGPGRAGALAADRAAIGATGAQTLAQSTGDVERLSTEQARAEKAAILARILAQRDKIQGDVSQAMKGAVDTGFTAAGYRREGMTTAGARAAALADARERERDRERDR